MSHLRPENDSPLILVVDDEKPMRILLRRAMERQGYQVVEASDGRQCLEVQARHRPDIILLDAVMPVMDGFTCCSELQKLARGERVNGSPDQELPDPKTQTSFLWTPSNGEYESTPVLMITGLEDPESVDRAFAAGATDYVTKPIHWPILRQRVRRLLQNRQLIRELQQQTERERLMARMLERIRHSLNLEEVLKTTVAEVRQFLQADRVLIYRFFPDGSGITSVESVAGEWASALGLARESIAFEHCAMLSLPWSPSSGRQLRIQAIEDITTAELTSPHKDWLEQLQVRANLVVPIVLRSNRSPLVVGEPANRSLSDSLDASAYLVDSEWTTRCASPPDPRLWGLLIAHHCSQQRRWQPSEIEFVEHLAAQVAIAIQQSQLYEQLEVANTQLQRLAAVDGLTGVANRRHFDESLEREWQRSERERLPISLILADVDFFKLYNDTYGHQAGDECLKQVAHAIREVEQQPAAVAARYGGEEFAVILPRTEPPTAFAVAESIRRRVAALQIPHSGSPAGGFVSMSLGVASSIRPDASSSGGDALGALIATADKALYQAKQQGRDRTVLKIC